MRHEDLDRILSGEEEILPSSGFACSVMDALRREASTPPPIPFPWKRALPGLAVGVLSLVLALVAIFALPGGTAAPEPAEAWTSLLGPILEAAQRVRADLVVLALLLTIASVALSTHLASRRARRS